MMPFCDPRDGFFYLTLTLIIDSNYLSPTCSQAEVRFKMAIMLLPISLCCWFHCVLFGPRREKTCLRGFANNTGADQPAHPRRLISASVIRFLESIICKLGAGEISIF